jgi:hypothetical protein
MLPTAALKWYTYINVRSERMAYYAPKNKTYNNRSDYGTPASFSYHYGIHTDRRYHE